MANILYFLGALLIFGIIVVAHELGHFLSARALGIKVLEFSVGFGPRLLGWRRHDIAYSLRLIPLGGYCKFPGEDDGDTASPDAINNQPAWKRFITIFSGPLMNFVLAYVAVVLYLAIFGFYFVSPKVSQFTEGLPAETSGMQVGDVICEVNGVPIEYSVEGTSQLLSLIGQADPAQPLKIGVMRDGERIDLSITPQQTEDGNYQIGIVMGVDQGYYRFYELFGESALRVKDIMYIMLDALRALFTTGEGLDQTMGPVGMISLMTEEVRQGFDMALNLIVIISMNLGIMNLLPLPALDGGRLVFIVIEWIRRKPVKPELEVWVHAAGFILLLGLILVITYRDVVRLITG